MNKLVINSSRKSTLAMMCILILFIQNTSLFPVTIANVLKLFLPSATLILVLRENQFILKKNIVILWNVFLIFVCFVTLFVAVDKSLSLSRILSLVSLLINILAISQFSKTKSNILLLIDYLIYGAIIFTALTLIQNFLELKSFNISEFQFSMSFNNVVTTTLYFVIWSFFYQDQRKKIISLVMIFLIGVSLISGIKKATFFPLIYFITLLLFKNRKNVIKNSLYITILLISFFLIFRWFTNSDVFYEILGNRIEGFLNYFTNNGRVDGSTRVRIGLIEEGWIIFKENPILGVGIGGFSAVNSYNLYAHNNFIEILASAGFVGFLSFYWIHLYLIITLYKKFKTSEEPLVILFLSIIIFNLVHDLGTISYYRINYIIPLSLAGSYIKLSKETKIKNKSLIKR